MVALDANVRQADPQERAALAALRDGSVADAVSWYAGHGRIHVEATRPAMLVAMTDAWATDVAAGHDAALLAWRRHDVADLNRLARDHWADLGHLHGDDVEVARGRWYASGDRLVAVAPNHAAGIVTSEPLTVTDVTEGAMTVQTADGRAVSLEGDALDSAHLDYGYAVTVHRAQGATYDRAHVLAAGGGRELAYVAMSRARDGTTIHATADDLAQAVDDLYADWAHQRLDRWVTDTPARRGHAREPARALTADAHATESCDQSLPHRRREAELRLAALHVDHDALHAGTGRWQDTAVGAVARDMNDARTRLTAALVAAQDPNARRRDRRAAAKRLPELEHAVEIAERAWERIGAPDALRLRATISATTRELTELDSERLTARMDGLRRRGPRRSIGHDRALGL